MNAMKPYRCDLRWRIVWAYYRPTYHLTQKEISDQFHVSERTVHRYLQLFRQTGDVEIRHRRDGPGKLLGNFEQLTLLRLVLTQPGLYLHELQEMLNDDYGVVISIPTICRALKQMGCTRQSMHHVALQQSNYLRAKFMAEVSCYDPSMLVCLDETGCDNRNALRQKAYSIRGMPLNNHQLLIRGVRYSAIPIVSLDTNKASGPDNIHPYILKNCANEISPILQVIFTQSLDTGILPSDWLMANVCPVFKKGNRTSTETTDQYH